LYCFSGAKSDLISTGFQLVSGIVTPDELFPDGVEKMLLIEADQAHLEVAFADR